MEKINKLIPFLGALLLLSSCETTQQTFSDSLSGAISGQPAHHQAAINDLTNNGTTLPSTYDISDMASNPGDIDYNCVGQNGSSTTSKPQVGSYDSKHPVIVNSKPTDKDPNYQVSLKNYPRPARGCIPVEKVSLQDARAAMKAHNLTTEGATEMEQRTLGAGLIRIMQLNGGPLKSGTWKGSKPYPFRVVGGGGYSGQRADHIIIRRNGGRKYGLSVAQHVHEYAHLIGNQGAYGAYRSFMGGVGYCMVSNYADNNANEQFAEAFTAFVTEPSILLNNSRTPKACKKAYEFFKGWFKDGERVEECMKPGASR